jgi:hypothetical protein
MSRGPSTFRQRDVAAAAKAAKAAGLEVHRVEIDKAGRIVLVTSTTEAERREREGVNEWDAADAAL